MSKSPNREIDPDPALLAGGPTRPTRRKVGPAKIALAFVLAVLITAATFGILSLVLWALAVVFH